MCFYLPRRWILFQHMTSLPTGGLLHKWKTITPSTCQIANETAFRPSQQSKAKRRKQTQVKSDNYQSPYICGALGRRNRDLFAALTPSPLLSSSRTAEWEFSAGVFHSYAPSLAGTTPAAFAGPSSRLSPPPPPQPPAPLPYHTVTISFNPSLITITNEQKSFRPVHTTPSALASLLALPTPSSVCD